MTNTTTSVQVEEEEKRLVFDDATDLTKSERSNSLTPTKPSDESSKSAESEEKITNCFLFADTNELALLGREGNS